VAAVVAAVKSGRIEEWLPNCSSSEGYYSGARLESYATGSKAVDSEASPWPV